MLMRSLFSIILGVAVLGMFGFSQSAFAAPFILSNGPGDGTLSVGVDGFGAFGLGVGPDSSNAIYDPVGAGGSAGTSFESAIAIEIGTGGTRSFLTSGFVGISGGLANPTVMPDGSSTFSNSGLNFALSQTLEPVFFGGSQTGTLLIQTYTITNPGTTSIDFELVRYLDGDLFFDGSSTTDGGGRIIIEGTEILFETDSATGSSTSTNYVAIIAEGGTEPATNRYEIDRFSEPFPLPGMRDRIIAGTALDDTVTGDGGDADEFIDAGPGYDVTLALRNTFSLGQGTSVVYVTKTIFGTGAPEDVEIDPPIELVGGIILPIDTMTLLIAGAQINAFFILSTLALTGAFAFGVLYYKTKRTN